VLVAKLDPNGKLLYCKRFGGGSGSGIKVRNGSIVYIVGSTGSSDFQIKNGVQSKPAGKSDGFIASLDASSASLISSTYLGGSENDNISAVAIDAFGSIIVAGTR
jgi:hypothetical protein